MAERKRIAKGTFSATEVGALLEDLRSRFRVMGEGFEDVRGRLAAVEAQVREFCKTNLTGYKQPKVVEFRTELPKTPVGKILRRELRDKK